LSSKSDLPYDIQVLHRLKDREWLQRSASSLTAKQASKISSDIVMTTKERLEAKRKLKLKKKLKEGIDLDSKKRKKMSREFDGKKVLKGEKRRKSLTVHNLSDGATSVIMDLTGLSARLFKKSRLPTTSVNI